MATTPTRQDREPFNSPADPDTVNSDGAASVPSVVDEATANETSPGGPSRVARLVWSGVVAALLLFVAFGSLSLQAGEDEGDVVRMRDLWSQLTGVLELRGLPGFMVVFVWATVAVAAAAAVWALWLAAAVRDDPQDTDSSPA